MAESKSKGVQLTNSNSRVSDITLEISHAERLLKMPQNGGWKLPENSPYKLTADGLIKKSNKRNTEKPRKQASN
ncbi:hypothetical protein B620_gp10 [Croceibacter phage P2559S]|uniref:hypothetical protein n=1 Tax=Croceibacter phage P2559S TaxID=1176422 RepID=UPI0002688E6F|nr:hypothetical protein B620_gp10 [Croceibacter phage P2559S]AFM54788.1 hypothetical protein P2559S_10 [Croceibacter phage P2559S]